jgi:hypothetical protein
MIDDFGDEASGSVDTVGCNKVKDLNRDQRKPDR